MPSELSFFIVAAIIANILVIGALFALPRGRGRFAQEGTRPDPGSALAAAREGPDKYVTLDPDGADSAEQLAVAPSYTRVLRVLWWLTIAAVLVGVGVSGAYADTQPLIFAVGGAAVIVVVVLHELMPPRWRTPGRFWIEALLAIGLVTALLVLTGYGGSPFFFAYVLVAVAVALVRGGVATLGVAALASLAYGVVLGLDPDRAAFGGDDLLGFALNIGSMWLLAFLAGVYAVHERRIRSRVLQLSQVDPLTGLFNRSQIFATLDQEIRRTRRSERGFCILMLDLDGLKAVNDTLGHHRGDDLLRRLGSVIRRSIRTVDTAYRYGGDEFVILLPETTIVGAFVVAEKIRAGAEEVGPTLDREGVEASVSIGLVSHPEDGTTVEELMIAADRAMYQAKSLGKNQISGYPHPRRALPPAPEAAPARAAANEPTLGEPPAPTRLRPVEMAGQPTDGEEAEAAATAAAAAAATPERHGEEEPDPAEVRRQIASASRSFDPDHQIRRAMDAFLSPSGSQRERPEGRPEP